MRMVELEPERFLDRPQRAVEAQVAAANALLREALAGADIEAMLIEDPALLFEELQSLETGMPASAVPPLCLGPVLWGGLACCKPSEAIRWSPCKQVLVMQGWPACTSCGMLMSKFCAIAIPLKWPWPSGR